MIHRDNKIREAGIYLQVAFGVDIRDFSQASQVIATLRRRISGIRNSNIIAIGSPEMMMELQQAIQPDLEVLKINQQFINELGDIISRICKPQVKSTWKKALEHFKKNNYKLDCGISTLGTISVFQSVAQKFNNRWEILNWASRLTEDEHLG